MVDTGRSRLHAAVHIHVFDAAELAESVRTYRRGRREKRKLPRRLDWLTWLQIVTSLSSGNFLRW